MQTSATLFVLLVAAAACLAPAAAQTADQQAALDLHNKYRAIHGSPALIWDADIARQTAAFVSQCQFRMEAGLPVGQNLGVSSGRDPTGQLSAMTNMWYETGRSYNFNNPGFTMQAGQFTQLVWKSTTKIGCAAVACNNIAGFGQAGILAACRYSPPGNVQGGFQSNVGRPGM